ncbi:MAG: hypothetical protein K2K63_03610 [Acetatifactor sp.]|nr:hypothetical protein [Acetatifactor sp.]
MKNLVLYESFGSIDDEILERSEKKMKNTVTRRLTRWGALAACACLAVVTAFSALEFFVPDSRYDTENLTGQPSDVAASDVTTPDDIYVARNDAPGYDTPGQDGESVNNAPGTPDAMPVTDTPGTPDTMPVTDTPGTPDATTVIGTPSTPDVEPVINESAPNVESVPDNGSVADDHVSVESTKKEGSLRDNRETLTLQEGLETETLGAYLLAEAPRGFQLESLKRTPEGESLFSVWTKSGAYDEIDWKVSLYSEADANRVTAAADTRNYDLSLYPIPLCDSVPEELRQIVDHPIFSIDELTQDVVNRRAYYVNDSGDTAGARMTFGVLYGEVLVEVTTKGVSPEWLYEQLSSLESDTP